MTADEILAAATSPADVLDGHAAALKRCEEAAAAFKEAVAAADKAQAAAHAAWADFQPWKEAVERLHAAAMFLNQLESN